MFGLWYISLAIDEIRKYFGLSSIFDIVRTNKNDSKSIENKPATNSASIDSNVKTIDKPAKPKDLPVTKPIETPKLPAEKPNNLPDKKTPEPPKTPTVSNDANQPQIQKKTADVPLPPPNNPPPVPKSVNPTTPPKPASTSQPLTTKGAQNDDVERKMFGNGGAKNKLNFENGDDSAKGNIKDSTSSFLDGESRGNLRQKRDELTPR